MGKGTGTRTISYPLKYQSLMDWADGQTKKKHLKLESFSAVIRKCLEIVRDKNLLSEK